MKNNFNSIYILGGHKLATTYFDKIKIAQTNGRLKFDHIFCVTDDSQAPAHSLCGSNQVISKSASEFILEYAHQKQSGHMPSANDTLIPDHTAKHVMLQTFLDLVKLEYPERKTALSPFAADFAPPFLHKSENAAIWAMSYATWLCPPDCDEPRICPHIAAKRDWDLGVNLAQLMKNLSDADHSKHIFACESLVDELAQIPMDKITSEIAQFKSRLLTAPPQKVLVATHSHCHGILGQFEIR